MTRATRTYADHPGHRAYAGLDVSTPTAGFYRMKMRAGGVYGGVKVWYGPPLDPVTGDELDRGWRWQATFDGRAIDLDRVWPACGREPITEAEYARLIMQASWAREHAPGSAYADLGRKYDPLDANQPLSF